MLFGFLFLTLPFGTRIENYEDDCNIMRRGTGSGNQYGRGNGNESVFTAGYRVLGVHEGYKGLFTENPEIEVLTWAKADKFIAGVALLLK